MTPVAADTVTSRIHTRPFQNEDDFWRVRNLLIETCPITPTDFNWDVRRWDGWRFYTANPAWNPDWGMQVRLWETEDGQLVGAVHHDGAGSAGLELHPDYRHIEADMIAWAEKNLARPTDDGQKRQLEYFVWEYDSPRRRLLEQQGYEKTSRYGVVRRLRFGDKPIPPSVIAAGYTLHTTCSDDMGDCQRIADILNAAFNRDFHNAEEYHTFTRLAPSYRGDLDLVAEAPDGSFAAYVGIPYDETNRRGIFEPVCTHPDHRRKGLARALMLEGMRRLKALGAADVTVGTGDMIPANQLYEAVGFTEAYQGYIWRKVF